MEMVFTYGIHTLKYKIYNKNIIDNYYSIIDGRLYTPLIYLLLTMENLALSLVHNYQLKESSHTQPSTKCHQYFDSTSRKSNGLMNVHQNTSLLDHPAAFMETGPHKGSNR